MRIVIILFCLYISISSSAQDIYNFNQNFQVNEYVNNGSFKMVYSGDSEGKYTLTKIPLNRKDTEGNEIYCLRLVKPKSMMQVDDTLDLFPDNMFYPTHFKAVEQSYGFHSLKDEYIVINGGLISEVSAEVSVLKEESSYSDQRNYAIDIRMKGHYEFQGKGKGQIKNTKDFYEFMEVKKNEGQAWSSKRWVSEYKGIGRYLEARNNQLDAIMEEGKNKGYDKLLGEQIKDELYFIYDGEADIIAESSEYWKLIGEKDASGALTSLKVHKPYKDGKFYDKEHMFISCTKNSQGIFEFKYDGMTLQVLPFDGYILLGYFGSNSVTPKYCLANKIDDGSGGHVVNLFAHHLAK